MNSNLETPTLHSLGLLSEQEVADLYGVSVGTLRNWRVSGKGPPFTKLARNTIAYPETGIRRHIARNTVTPRPSAA